MKQHITTEQLNELSDKGKERLRAWYEPKYGRAYKLVPDCHSDPTCCWKDDETKCPLLSIGQMIEFLTAPTPHGHLIVCTEDKESTDHGWRVVQGGKTDEETKMYPFYMELCDALWQACKEVLEDK